MKSIICSLLLLVIPVEGCAKPTEWHQKGSTSTELIHFDEIGNPLEKDFTALRDLYAKELKLNKDERFHEGLVQRFRAIDSALPEMTKKWEEFKGLSEEGDQLYFVRYLEDSEYVLVRNEKKRASIQMGGSNFDAGKIEQY